MSSGPAQILGGGNFPKCTIAYMVNHSFKIEDTVNSTKSIRKRCKENKVAKVIDQVYIQPDFDN